MTPSSTPPVDCEPEIRRIIKAILDDGVPVVGTLHGQPLGGYPCADIDALAKWAEQRLEAERWRPISEAPTDQRVMLWGNGPIRFGYKDKLGNWRASHHGPVRGQPTHFMQLPSSPTTTPKSLPTDEGSK